MDIYVGALNLIRKRKCVRNFDMNLNHCPTNFGNIVSSINSLASPNYMKL